MSNITDDHDDMIESRDSYQEVRAIIRKLWYGENTTNLHKTIKTNTKRLCKLHKTIKNNNKRLCKCGCGVSIEHKHIKAKFFNQKHKDSYHNWNNPRGKFSHLSEYDGDYDAGDFEYWDRKSY